MAAPRPVAPSPAQHTKSHGLMVIYAALVSTSFPVGAFATRSMDPVAITFLRFALASALFGAILAHRGQLRRVGLRDLARYSVVSASIVIFFVLMFEALRHTDPVNTSALFTLVPLGSAGVAAVLLKQRTRLAVLACLVTGALGAAWVVFDGELSGALAMRLDRGERTFLLATVVFAAYVPLIKRLHRGEPALVMTFWTLATGTVLLGTLGAPRMLATSWTADPATYAAVAYLAIFPTAITFAIAQYVSVRLSAEGVLAYTYLTPSFVVLLEGLRGKGWPSASVFAGVAVTLCVTVLLQRLGRSTA